MRNAIRVIDPLKSLLNFGSPMSTVSIQKDPEQKKASCKDVWVKLFWHMRRGSTFLNIQTKHGIIHTPWDKGRTSGALGKHYIQGSKPHREGMVKAGNASPVLNEFFYAHPNELQRNMEDYQV